MSNSKIDTFEKSIDDLMNEEDFNQLSKKVIKEIKISFRRTVFLLIIVICTIIMLNNAFNGNTNAIDAAFEIINIMNSLIIGLFAIIITGYAIFQALANGNALIALMSVNGEKGSKFKEYNQYFFFLSLSYLVFIFINILLLIFLKITENNWEFTYFTSNVNSNITAIFLSLYMGILLYLVIEIKSFIFNLYSIFTINATSIGISHYQKIKKDFEDEN